jgi:hypothetical protein
MTLQEILKAKGLSDEDIESVIGEMKQNKIFTASEENLDIRYKKLKDDHDALTTTHGESTKLIEQLKAGSKDNEVLQGKITSYEATVANLQKELEKTKVESAARLELMNAKAVDVEYMLFKMREKGELELDEHGKLKGADDMIAALKTQHPTQFESVVDKLEVQVQKLPNQNNVPGKGITKEEFNKMGYESRVKLKEADPDLYAQLTK